MDRHPPPPPPPEGGGGAGGLPGVNFPHQVPHRDRSTTLLLMSVKVSCDIAYSCNVQNDVSSAGSTMVALKSPHRFSFPLKVLK